MTTADAQTVRTWTPDGAWCWFGEQRGTQNLGPLNRTWWGSITNDGDIQVTQYDADNHRLTTTDVAYDFTADDHNNPSLVQLPDLRLIVFWTGHAEAHVPLYWRVGTYAQSSIAWGPVQTRPFTESVPGGDGLGYTYPNPVWNTEENRLYLFWRGRHTSPHSQQQDVVMTHSDDLGQTWAPVVSLLQNVDQRPYAKFEYDGHGGIGIAVTDGHPNEVQNNNVYYTRLYQGKLYRAGGQLEHVVADGPLNINMFNLDMVHSATAVGYPGWIWDLAYSPEGYPRMVIAGFPSTTDHRYRYISYDPNPEVGWENRLITSAGGAFETSGREPMYSGGITLDHANPNQVYLSKKVEEHWEIFNYRTVNLGTSWAYDAVTAASTENNVRPYLVRGAGAERVGLLWMRGGYVHWDEYDTRIVGLPDVTEERTVVRIRSSVTPDETDGAQTVVVGARAIADGSGQTIPGLLLYLWARESGSKDWKVLATGTTDVSGLKKWDRLPRQDAEYEIRYSGDTIHTPAVSARVKVTVE